MAFTLLDTLRERTAAKSSARGEKSPLAFRDDSEGAYEAIYQHAQETSRKVRERFSEITGYSLPLETALQLPAQQFEARFIPSFTQLFQNTYAGDIEKFDTVLKALQEEFIRTANYMKILGKPVGYMQYVDTFRVRVLREIGKSQ